MGSAYVPLLAGTAALSLVCLLQFVLTQVGATHGVGPNRVAGIKTKATLASDAAWKAGHDAAQPALLATAVTGLGLAAPLALWQASSDGEPPAPFTAACVLTAVVVSALLWTAVRRADRAARQTVADGGEKR